MRRGRRSEPALRRVLRGAVLGLAVALLGGCGLLYENSCRGENFVLYSDRSEAFLETTARKVDDIFFAFEALFEVDDRRVGRTTIVLEGSESNVVDFGYSPSLLGYYVPLLRLISVDTGSAWTSAPEALEQVLLHEIAHHFIALEFPGATWTCWLNEGLAGTLEVSRIQGKRHEFPLLNPILLQVAQRTAVERGETLSLVDVVALDWGSFHEPPDKERNYALAWSIVYYLLEHAFDREATLGQRVERLYEQNAETLRRWESGWVDFLRTFDLTARLVELARSDDPARRLTSRWAIGQMAELRGLDDHRVLHALVDLFEDGDVAKRLAAYLAFIRRIERHPHSSVFARAAVRRGCEALSRLLVDPAEPTIVRELLADAVGAGMPAERDWLEALVDVLDDDSAKLRVAAAGALSRAAAKPTIVNPAFWEDAGPAARGNEVREWREWLQAQALQETGP